MGNYTITDIENMTENEAKEMAEETAVIKGFNIYFINFPGYFGYSYLVFKNGHHIHYANDYELHHKSIACEKGIEGLRMYYLGLLYTKLYEDDEFVKPLSSYDEYEAKRYFLQNYYAMQVDRVSMFHIFKNEEEEKEHERLIEGMILDPVGYCYVNDKDFVKHHVELFEALKKAKADTVNNYEYQKNAFIHELYNHEYQVTADDEAVLTAFGLSFRKSYRTLGECFDALKFTPVQRQAYLDARKEVA